VSEKYNVSIGGLRSRRISAWDRNTARTTLDGEFPNHALFRYVQRVPSSTIAHVSVNPRFIPDGRISPDLSGLATLTFPCGPSRYRRNLSADSHTPLAITVYPQARHITAVIDLAGSKSRAVPLKCPSDAESPFAHNRCYTLQGHKLRFLRFRCN